MELAAQIMRFAIILMVFSVGLKLSEINDTLERIEQLHVPNDEVTK